MTRILTVEGSGDLWGSERALLDLIQSIGTENMAVCCPPGRPLIAELARLHIRTLPYYIYKLHEKSRWQRLKSALGVLQACLEFGPDLIYLNQAGVYRVAMLAARLLGLPIVAHVRIFEDAAYLARQRASTRQLRSLIAISSAIENEIRCFPELDIIPVHRVYDAYATTQTDDFPSDRIWNRVACVGRLVPVKGQDILLRALRLMDSSQEMPECLMIGDGDANFLQELQQIVSSTNQVTNIRWLGFQKEVLQLLQTCSVLACPSHREPLGRVIFEAWEGGAVPVVFAGSGGAAEIVAASQGGLIYQKQDAECIAATLHRALHLEPEHRKTLLQNGRSWISQNCSPKRYGDTLSTIFSDAAVSLTRSVCRREVC